jgi:NAD(P) transhydrogenase subunit alpha
MIERMTPGSVIVDLSAERGGNCELTRLNQTVVEHDVHIIGTINMASSVPYHASQLYAYNIGHFLSHLFKDGRTELDLGDEITRETLLTRNGEIVNQRVRDFYAAAAPASS